jgi:hypothetical protein
MVKKRDGFNRMIADAENGEIDLILTKEVSRFARNTVDTLIFTRRLAAKNVGVIFTSDNIDTRDKDGELRLTIMASIAQEESRKTSERTRWGVRRSMEKGVVFGSKARLGYRTIDGVLTVVPKEAEIVKRIYKEYVYENKGSHTIGKELNTEKLFTVAGNCWQGGTILKILTSEIYVGDLVQGKRHCVDFLTKTYADSPEEMYVVIRDHHEPIIDRETWELTQALVTKRGKMTVESRRHSWKFWYSNKIRCGICGRSYVSNKKAAKAQTLHCNNRRMNGAIPQNDDNGNIFGCSNIGVSERVFIQAMECVLQNIEKTRDEVISDLLNEIKAMQKNSKSVDVAPIKAEIEKLGTKKRNAIDLMLEGLISKDDLKGQTEFYDTEIARLTETLYRNKNINSVNLQQIQNIKECIEKIKETAGITECNNDIYRELLDKILVNNDNTIDVFLNCVPFGFKVAYSTVVRSKKFYVTIESCSIIE